MVGENRVMMSGKELRRGHVIRQVLEKRITQGEAGTMVRLTDRQIRRLLRRVKEAGNQGLVHRGRPQGEDPPGVWIPRGMGTLGQRWPRRNWPSGTGSRSVTRRCGCGCRRAESIILRGDRGRIERGARGRRMSGS